MGWSGGSFTRTNGTYSGASVWASDEGAGIGIEAARQDTHDQDLAQGINACIAKDGSNAATGDLDLGSHKVTALANGTSRNHAHTVAQAQDGSVIWGGTSSGSANAQTITLSPSPGALATGQTFRFKAGYTNTASATLNVNALGAVTLYKETNGLRAALGGSDIIANGIYDVTYDSASGGQFVLHTSKPGMASFSPSFTPSAGALNSATHNYYCSKSGQVMTINFMTTGTQATATCANYQFTLPTAVSASLGIPFTLCFVNSAAAYDTGIISLNGSTATISRMAGSNFALGVTVLSGTFSYLTD